MTQPNFNASNVTLTSAGPKPKQRQREKIIKEQEKLTQSKPGESIICQIISIEPYFKRTIAKLGWSL